MVDVLADLHPVKGGGRYGWLPDLPDLRDLVDQFEDANFDALPPTVDLRTTGLLPSVYDQGQLGSCTANAAGAAMEYLAAKQGLPTVTPSRLFIYWNERYVEGTVSEDSGAQIRDAVKVLNKYGVCPENEWPYDISVFTEMPPQECYKDAAQSVALRYARIWRSDGRYIKASLANGYPVIVGFTVYDSFESRVGADGIMPMPDTRTESLLGGHAVLVVGYTTINSKEYWIVRNSWGSGWGDAGYFYMPKEYLTTKGLSSDFWAVRLEGASTHTTPAPTNQEDVNPVPDPTPIPDPIPAPLPVPADSPVWTSPSFYFNLIVVAGTLAGLLFHKTFDVSSTGQAWAAVAASIAAGIYAIARSMKHKVAANERIAALQLRLAYPEQAHVVDSFYK